MKLIIVVSVGGVGLNIGTLCFDRANVKPNSGNVKLNIAGVKHNNSNVKFDGGIVEYRIL
ncbi:MAG: hypothetical protein JXQ69_06830 [Paludibacteraceae bacterium]|nr:hypothetical protein [Paludibacteraceae bacterium]MBN2788020.1 hypothetical protein [Paludibacteraceae bacterium]